MITQAVESEIPVGRLGLALQAVIVPPEFVGVRVAIAEFLVQLKGLPVYPRTGATSLTVTLIPVEAVPPALVAVTV